MRLGKIYVSDAVVKIDNGVLGQALCALKFIPLRVEFLYYRDQFEYIGTSHMFDDIEQGEEAPEYIMQITTDGGAIKDIDVVRK